jgi:hypothetical protein
MEVKCGILGRKWEEYKPAEKINVRPTYTYKYVWKKTLHKSCTNKKRKFTSNKNNIFRQINLKFKVDAKFNFCKTSTYSINLIHQLLRSLRSFDNLQ